MSIAFIDGENTKGRIRDVFLKYGHQIPPWEEYDFKGLFDKIFELRPIPNRKYFRAKPLPHGDTDPVVSVNMSTSYRNLGGHLSRQGFEVIKAGTLRADYRNPRDKKPTYREKGVDVSLAVSMVSLVCDNKIETAYLVASDSDYQPAVSEIRRRGKRVVYVGFAINPNLGLIAKTNDRIIIPDALVLQFGGIEVEQKKKAT